MRGYCRTGSRTPPLALSIGLLFLLGACGSGPGSRSLDVAGGGSGGGSGGDAGTPDSAAVASGGAAGTATGGGGSDASAAGGTDTGGGSGEAPDAPVDVPASETAAACSACAAYGPVQRLGMVQIASLSTVSGMAASHRNPGVLFVHNDGVRPEFFAVSEAGAPLGQFTLGGVTARDVEDIAVGRCPTGLCVYLADIGDNSARPDYTILRTPEPAVNSTGGAAPVTVTAERLLFTYPDGGHNAETLLVDPANGNLYVITKVAVGVRSSVYRLPATFGGASAVAIKVADLTVPAAADQPATSGDAHPCGTGFLLRTLNTLYEFRIPGGAPFEDAFRATPAAVPAATEQKSEGVTYAPDGRSYYTTSEGSFPPINRVTCR